MSESAIVRKCAAETDKDMQRNIGRKDLGQKLRRLKEEGG